jgi:hypothetical protein
MPLTFLALLTISTGACGAPADDAGTTGSAVVEDELQLDQVKGILAKLDAQRGGNPIGPYYKDGARIEGCWRNPAGSKLTDLQKALYCSMPLEFRLCNTIVLLKTDESRVDDRYQGYLDCQKKVDGVFGSRGEFVYDSDVNAMYKRLFLQGAKLSAADEANVVAARKPVFSTRPFPVVIVAIVEGLTKESVDLSTAALETLVKDFISNTGQSPG